MFLLSKTNIVLEKLIMGDPGGVLRAGLQSELSFLRAPDRKFQKSHDRSEISDFILFPLNVPFGELFSKITIKSSAALSFF